MRFSPSAAAGAATLIGFPAGADSDNAQLAELRVHVWRVVGGVGFTPLARRRGGADLDIVLAQTSRVDLP